MAREPSGASTGYSVANVCEVRITITFVWTVYLNLWFLGSSILSLRSGGEELSAGDRRSLWALMQQPEFITFRIIPLSRVTPKVRLDSLSWQSRWNLLPKPQLAWIFADHWFVWSHVWEWISRSIQDEGILHESQGEYPSIATLLLFVFIHQILLFPGQDPRSSNGHPQAVLRVSQWTPSMVRCQVWQSRPLCWLSKEVRSILLISPSRVLCRFVVMDGDMLYTESRLKSLLTSKSCKTDADCTIGMSIHYLLSSHFPSLSIRISSLQVTATLAVAPTLRVLHATMRIWRWALLPR